MKTKNKILSPLKRDFRFASTFAFCLLSFSPSAQIINVTGDYPTIQQGINAANSWFDTVLVAPGTYYENINFMGKQITVASNYCLSGDTNDIINTIIDGSQPVNPDMASVVTFSSYEDTNSVICGFTITGGTGSIVQAGIRSGGGINIVLSGAKIIHNYIEYNVVSGDDIALGGSISHGPPGDNNDLVIKNNKIRDNAAIGATQAFGGGIRTFGNVIICNNLISNNTCKNLQQQGDYLYAFGGGMDIDADGDPREIYISDNIISNNQAISESNYHWTVTGCGGVRLVRTYGIFKNNKILSNEISSIYNLYGCGLVVVLADTSLIICDNTIAYNYFDGGECLGGGVFVESGTAKFYNNLLFRNHATKGGGFYFWDPVGIDGNSLVINNTIAFNKADEDGGAIFGDDETPYVFNSILWENESNTGAEISGDCEVRYSCVDGEYPGEGNIDEDPEFLDPDNDDFHIDDYSPCYNEGEKMTIINSTWLPCPDHDFEGDDRPDNYTLITDMGADEYKHPEWIDEQSNNSLVNLSIYPNPCSSTTQLRFTSHVSRLTSIDLYSIDGRKIRELANENQMPGEYEIEVDVSNLATGVYLIRVQTGSDIINRKLIVK